jgi:glutamate/tyrosine decarboxylase-like PLP-dependent enzyme
VLNQNLTAWRSAPSGFAIELTVLGWLAEAIGCSGLAGTFTSGGSLGNLMALAMARESRAPANEGGVQPGVVYASEQVHMSIPKAVAMLGLGRANLRLIAVDKNMRIDMPALKAAIAGDREAGLRGIAVIGSAGTIMSGAIDPLAELAAVARQHDLWFHVDGAYGAAAALAAPEKFVGICEADSISLDAHKWLYQPLDCSVLLYRVAAAARRAFAYSAEYLKTTSYHPVEGFAFFDQTIELSRRFRALKLWLSLRYHGLAAFREAIADNLAQARLLADLIEVEPSLELLAPVEPKSSSGECWRNTARRSAATSSTTTDDGSPKRSASNTPCGNSPPAKPEMTGSPCPTRCGFSRWGGSGTRTPTTAASRLRSASAAERSCTATGNQPRIEDKPPRVSTSARRRSAITAQSNPPAPESGPHTQSLPPAQVPGGSSASTPAAKRSLKTSGVRQSSARRIDHATCPNLNANGGVLTRRLHRRKPRESSVRRRCALLRLLVSTL